MSSVEDVVDFYKKLIFTEDFYIPILDKKTENVISLPLSEKMKELSYMLDNIEPNCSCKREDIILNLHPLLLSILSEEHYRNGRGKYFLELFSDAFDEYRNAGGSPESLKHIMFQLDCDEYFKSRYPFILPGPPILTK